MNALHKSRNLSGFAPVCVCPVIYSCAPSFGGGGDATWNITLRDNLAKQNNVNKQEKIRKKEGKKEGKHFKRFFLALFPFSSKVQAICLQALIVSNHLGPKQHWNNGCRSASVAGLVELW